jgi:hypothetical protein
MLGVGKFKGKIYFQSGSITTSEFHMGNTLRLICMAEDGRTWQCRIRTAWVKICLCGILALLPISGVGVYGAFFFWHKESLAAMENEAMRSTMADMRDRLNRLEVFERVLHTHDQRPPQLYGKEHSSPRFTDADMKLKAVEPGVVPVPWVPSSRAELSVASDSAPARRVSGRQPMGNKREDDRESHGAVVAGYSSAEPTGHVSEALVQEMRQDSTPETDTDLKSGPRGAVSSHIEAMTNSASSNLADASNVRLALEDDSMELRFDLHNRSDTAIAGRISVSFIVADSQVVKADGDHRALRFRIRRFREVCSPLLLPASTSMTELQAMRLDILSHGGKLLYAATYPITELLQGVGGG